MRQDNERIIVGGLAIITGLIVEYISVIGPLFLGLVTYKSSASGVLQFIGQDLLNLIFVAPALIVGGAFLLLKKSIGLRVLAFFPLYLIYYGLSYATGIEWSNQALAGNSEHQIYFYISVIISGLLMLLYCAENMEQKEISVSKKPLIIYSVSAIVMTLLFTLSYIQAINTNLTAPTVEYLAAPALFWFVKSFDLSFLVPLMGISIYCLWTRPSKCFNIQLLTYGLFITMTSAVNMMAAVMAINSDPNYNLPVHIMFIFLELVSIIGFVFIIKSVIVRKANTN